MMRRNLIAFTDSKQILGILTKIVLVVLFSILLASPAIALENYADEPLLDDEFNEMNFNFGDSCLRLEELSDELLMQLLLSQNPKAWLNFCRVQDDLQCEEFSYLFDGLGYMTSSKKDQSVCRFEPIGEMRDWLPEFYRKYGASHFGKDNAAVGLVAASLR